MGWKMEDDNHEGEEVAPVLRAGSSLVACKPIFSSDSKWLVCGCGADIKVFSVKSGECVQTLRGHKKRVTALTLSPDNPYQLFSCGLDNTLIKWNYMDGIKLRTFQLATSLVQLLSTSKKDHKLLAVRHVPTNDTHDLVYLQLPEKGKDHANVVVLGIETDESAVVAVGGQDHFLAALRSNTLTVCPLNKKHRDSRKNLNPGKNREFTCLACHPVEHCAATGMSDGLIILWWGVLSNKVVQTSFHWHALPVLSLAFTTEGSYLLSGGHECVLVKWQTNSQDKDLIPRLGAPIVNIVTAKNNTLYTTCHSDNSLQILTSSLRVVQVLQGLTRRLASLTQDNPTPTGLLIDPRTNCIVTNGRPGHLQFYSLHTDKQLYNLDIVCQNYISPENLSRPLIFTEVEKAAFDSTGTWLATLQYRDDKETTPEMTLKFWLFKEETQIFELNTTVDLPHTDKVQCLCFRTGEGDWLPMAATTSIDGKFKLWQLVDDTDIYRTNQCWNCESVGFYRNLPAGAADFSEDGSLLAVAFECTLTLWDPDSNGLKTTLSSGCYKNPISHIKFGLGSCSHLLVCTSSSQLYVWNLLTCSVEWTKSREIALLVRDPSSDYMAYITNNDNNLVVFSPSQVSSTFTLNNVSTSPVLGAVFVPHQQDISEFNNDGELHWQSRSQLYLMNKNQELLTVVRSSAKSDAETQLAQSIAEHIPPTQFSTLLHGHHKKGFKEVELKGGGQVGLQHTEFLKQMLETPAHVLPPVSSLCSSFLEPLLPKAKGVIHQSEDDSDAEEDPKERDSDSDSDHADMETEDMETEDLQIVTSQNVNKDSVINEAKSGSDKPFSLLSLDSLSLGESGETRDWEKLQNVSFSWM